MKSINPWLSSPTRFNNMPFNDVFSHLTALSKKTLILSLLYVFMTMLCSMKYVILAVLFTSSVVNFFASSFFVYYLMVSLYLSAWYILNLFYKFRKCDIAKKQLARLFIIFSSLYDGVMIIYFDCSWFWNWSFWLFRTQCLIHVLRNNIRLYLPKIVQCI